MTWYTDNPDFTPCFERSVLLLLPCLFLWVFAIMDVYFSYTADASEIPWSPLNIAKLVLSNILSNVEFAMIFAALVTLPGSIPSYVSYPVDIYVPAIRAATLIFSTILLMYSKKKGVRSSGVQFMFWLFMLLAQAIRFRTVIMKSGEVGGDAVVASQDVAMFVMEVIYFPLVLGQFLLHCWADANPAYELTSQSGEVLIFRENNASF